jgi:hypothetical protein
MTKNLERFQKDLKELIEKGKNLEGSLLRRFSKGYDERFKKAHPTADFNKMHPDFYSNYNQWYSESLLVIKQIIPDRLDNFVDFYKQPKNRKVINMSNYAIQDFLVGIVVGDGSSTLAKFHQQLNILESAEQRFKSSLFNIKTVLQADLFDNELKIAQELLKKGFVRASGAVARVVLEGHLKQVCSDHNIVIQKKTPTLSDFIENLKNNDVIEIDKFRKLQYLADITNLCCHNKEKEPTTEDVEDLIKGVNKTIKTIS